MQNQSTFDSLPNDVILCIFDYLKPHEKFQGFFDCNARFRKLVKCYTDYSRRALDKDIQRFSTLHSWYKHLRFVDDGVPFCMVPMKGEQARYNFSPCISDSTGVHWHFIRQDNLSLHAKRIEVISKKYPVKLNPLFHPFDSRNAILSASDDFIRGYYPEYYESLKPHLRQNMFSLLSNLTEFSLQKLHLQLESIHKREQKRLRDLIQKAARSVWEEIQALEDVNVLEIHYS